MTTQIIMSLSLTPSPYEQLVPSAKDQHWGTVKAARTQVRWTWNHFRNAVMEPLPKHSKVK